MALPRFLPALTFASVNRSGGWANGGLVLSRATGVASDARFQPK
ncbi:hypothetical protein [Marinimicrobium agarilyticum]|nr:hypothetical protein [Marinimicrobium agarilyticum]